jgi:DNA (cytosine-5)-methyltransferase 1
VNPWFTSRICKAERYKVVNETKKEVTLGSLFDGAGGFPYAGSFSGIKTVWTSEIEPFPIRVTTKRMPQVKHYGDVSALDGAKLEPVDIITFGSPCFPKGTLVLTDKGYMPIEEVSSGMKVLTHKGRWRKVTATGSKLGETVILKGNHYGLECTPNHPIYSSGERKDYSCLENDKHRNQILLTDEKDWIPAGEMKGHLWGVPNHADALPIPSPIYSSWKEKKCPPLSEKLFYFVGRWLGDGWVCNGQRAGRPDGETYGKIFLCDSYDKEEELIKTVRAVSKRYTIEHARTGVKISFCSRVFTEWLTDNFGQYASGKTLPAWVFGMQESWRAALLKGLLDSEPLQSKGSALMFVERISDGYKVKNHECEYRITTVSKRLAESVRLLGEMQGYSTTVFFVKTPDTTVIEGRTIRQKDYYTVELVRSAKKPHLSDNLHGWYRVRSVTPTHEVKPVYNLTVEEDNSYIADGIAVHNCQDLSIAGRRKGLGGSRSSLFYEAVRIVKEMREATHGEYPKYIVWENVPGAFSSNHGEDFRCVLENICRIKDENVSIPKPEKWNHAGLVVGDGYSVAWRVLDAQYWGVPQRRKRIYLVADFGGERAGKILFESESLSGNLRKSKEAWQETTGHSGKGSPDTSSCLDDPCGYCIGVPDATLYQNHAQDGRYKGPLSTADTVVARYGTGGNNQPLVVETPKFDLMTPKLLKIRCGCAGGGKGPLIQDNKSATLSCNNDQTLFQPVAYGIGSDQSKGMLSPNPYSGVYEASTSRTLDTSGGNPACNQGGIAVVAVQDSMIGRKDENGPQGSGINEDVSFTLNTIDRHAVAFSQEAYDKYAKNSVSSSLRARGGVYGGGSETLVYSTSKSSFHTRTEENMANTLTATDYKDPPIVLKEPKYIVRRLTPTECARLQGYPDDWCDDLGTDDPTEEEMAFWRDVFETHRRLVSNGTVLKEPFLGKDRRSFPLHATKPKTDNQIKKWLKSPHSDSAEYKMWGNSIAIPCALYVLSGIREAFSHD